MPQLDIADSVNSGNINSTRIITVCISSSPCHSSLFNGLGISRRCKFWTRKIGK